jgi:hypothetical protein
MVEKVTEGDRFNWRLPFYAVLGTLIFSIPGALCDPDSSLILYRFVVVPTVSIVLLSYAIGKKRRHCLSILSMLAVYWAISAALVENYWEVHDPARWLVWSHDYKAKVLAQPVSANGEQKHVEWDGWGSAGMETTVFLVFDPTDSLSAAAMSHRSGKFNGIPCEVPLVRRLESHWYTVRFYTDEYWGRRNVMDCGFRPKN